MVKKDYKTEYTSIWNRINQHNVDLNNLDKMTYQEFNKQIQSKAKTNGLFKRAKALARNISIQKDVNDYISKKQIPSSIIPNIKEKEYIDKYEKQIRFAKSTYGLQGYDKKIAKIEFNATSKTEIKNSIQKFKNQVKSSKNQNLKNPKGTKHYSINQKTEMIIQHPDGTIEQKDFYYNGRLNTKLSRSTNQLYKAKRKLDKFLNSYGIKNVQFGKTTLSIRVVY